MTIHGLSGTAEYEIWTGLRARCLNPNVKRFHRYGGRGITVCERWVDFPIFLVDMGPRPTADHQIERIDNDGPYSPENCRCATVKEQQRNRTSNRYLEVGGIRKVITEWAEITGIRDFTIRSRLDVLGWSPEDSVSRPVRKLRRSS